MHLDPEHKAQKKGPGVISQTWAAIRCLVYSLFGIIFVGMAVWELCTGGIALVSVQTGPVRWWQLAYTILVYLVIGGLFIWRAERALKYGRRQS